MLRSRETRERQHPCSSSGSEPTWRTWRWACSKKLCSSPGAPEAALSSQQKEMEARPQRWREGLGNRSSRAALHPRRGKPPLRGQRDLFWVSVGAEGYSWTYVWLHVGNTATWCSPEMRGVRDFYRPTLLPTLCTWETRRAFMGEDTEGKP